MGVEPGALTSGFGVRGARFGLPVWPALPDTARCGVTVGVGRRARMATPARCCEAVPWYCEAVPKRQGELGTIIGPKKHQRGVLCPIEGCWGPILPFGSCRLGHF